MTYKNENGVKVRIDGQGDLFANDHRKFVHRSCLMHDVDMLFGQVFFGKNTENNLFFEYATDGPAHNDKIIRAYATVCMFDRKYCESHLYKNKNVLGSYLHIWGFAPIPSKSSLCAFLHIS